MRKWIINKKLQVLYHLSILIDRAFECLVLRTLTNNVIACQIIKKQKALEVVEFQQEIPDCAEC